MVFKHFKNWGEKTYFQTKSYLQIETLGATGPVVHRQLGSLSLRNGVGLTSANQLPSVSDLDEKDLNL